MVKRGNAMVDPHTPATRGNKISSNQNNQPNEGGQTFDLQATEEHMEVGVNPTPTESPIPPDQERRLLRSPTSGTEGEGGPEDETTRALGSLKLRRKQLPGAARKRLSKLIKSGIPYQTALSTVLEQLAAGESRATCESQSSSDPAGTSKRLLSDSSPQDQRAKKPRVTESTKPSFNVAVKGVRVGFIHPDFPVEAFTEEQLGVLQRSILTAVDKLPDDGPQVRFLGCSHRPGWLLITCADQVSATWLESTYKDLQLWEGARLKVVQGEDIPKPHIYVAYIPDEDQGRLTSESVLLRLRKMNHGLNTREWKILHREESGPGQVWTFSVDDRSRLALDGLNNRPFFGFGQVQFRPKVKGERGKEPPAPKQPGSNPPAQEGKVERPPGAGGKSQASTSGKGKALPGKIPLKKGGAKPPSFKETKPPSPKPKPS